MGDDSRVLGQVDPLQHLGHAQRNQRRTQGQHRLLHGLSNNGGNFIPGNGLPTAGGGISLKLLVRHDGFDHIRGGKGRSRQGRSRVQQAHPPGNHLTIIVFKSFIGQESIDGFWGEGILLCQGVDLGKNLLFLGSLHLIGQCHTFMQGSVVHQCIYKGSAAGQKETQGHDECQDDGSGMGSTAGHTGNTTAHGITTIFKKISIKSFASLP